MTALTLSNALHSAGIALRRTDPGSYRAPCPQCNRGARDDALGVTISPDGSFIAHCFRCAWRAGWRPQDAAPVRPAARAAPPTNVQEVERRHAPLDLAP